MATPGRPPASSCSGLGRLHWLCSGAAAAAVSVPKTAPQCHRPVVARGGSGTGQAKDDTLEGSQRLRADILPLGGRPGPFVHGHGESFQWRAGSVCQQAPLKDKDKVSLTKTPKLDRSDGGKEVRERATKRKLPFTVGAHGEQKDSDTGTPGAPVPPPPPLSHRTGPGWVPPPPPPPPPSRRTGPGRGDSELTGQIPRQRIPRTRTQVPPPPLAPPSRRTGPGGVLQS
ncbi:hypothetical protein J1605_006924 [Eschrichtius robustus]|uniref:Uncharacterized protein n=1 Tax=Eschrichtius robustus TaxID=9764 RepID=A0AB34H2P2_ESCRO|nr:hypothetical protein J1605_006924 [Eschrichtius robustus]